MKYLLGVVVGLVFWAVLFGALSLRDAPAPSGSTVATPGAALPAMRAVRSESFGFAMDVPETWTELDADGFRRLLSEYLDVTDDRALELSVKTLVLGTVAGWPEGRPMTRVIINHQPGPRREVLETLEKVLALKQRSAGGLNVTQQPAEGTLGGFKGASMRARADVRTHAGTFEEESIIWVLWVSNGYMMITASAPTDDPAGMPVIEAILATFRDTVGG